MVNTNPINSEEEPFISCIINFYNANEIFFQEAIESVLTQTYKNWELLLVDDGSTNCSTDTALLYSKNYHQKIRYLEHEGHRNLGASATRNAGVEKAEGEYIAFLDADDVWFPHKLEQQVDIMKNNPQAAMVYGNSLYWLSWNNNPQNVESDYTPDLGLETNKLYEPPELVKLCYPLGYASTPPPSDILLRREAVIEVGGFEEDFKGIYQMYEDQVLFTKLFIRFPVYVTDILWDKYRLHPDSCCAQVSKDGQYHKVRSYYLRWLEGYLNQQKVQDKMIWKKYNKAQFAYRHPRLKYLFHIPRLLKKRAKNVLKALLWE